MLRFHRLLCAASLLGVLACEKTKPAAVTSPAASSPTASAPEATASAARAPVEGIEKYRSPAAGSNAFAFDLWSTSGRRIKGNFAFSPASISIAFAMAYGGAKGETAAQLKKVLHFEQPPDAVMTTWGAVSRSLSDPARPIKLRLANRLFGEKSYTFEPDYIARTRAAFGAPLEALDFKAAPDASRSRINGWVETNTESRIKDLLPARAIAPLTRMVLVNALYFLGDWDEPFDATRTQPSPFQTSLTTQHPVPMMRQTGYFAAGRAPNVKVAELPYKGGSASLLVVVPEKVDGLADVEASLSTATLESWTRVLTSQNVALSLPRFELDPKESLSLATDLKSLGLSLPFDPAKADFTAIANPADRADRIHLDDAIHKAFIKVDEKGTEAAAATALSAKGGGAPSEPFEVKVDRPFLFFVIDKGAGLILFMGRVADPA